MQSMADQEYNLQHIMQHASCHACLLINISETSKVQNHVKAYAAALLYSPATTHCPPKCIAPHTAHIDCYLCALCAVKT
jgi:hypothetical protein